MPAPAVLAGLFALADTVIDRFVPDKTKAAEAKVEFMRMAQAGDLKELEAVKTIITAEANSEHWLTANWRPLVMLTFTLLIVAHWLGFTAENLSEEQVLSLLDIVKIGIGGYVIGRSVEKAAKHYKGG